MRDLNLGPDTKKLIQSFSTFSDKQDPDYAGLAVLAVKMSKMLERWAEVGWCWPDACPATICGGPHVKVVYDGDSITQRFKRVEVIEPCNRIGTTFPEVPYHVIND